MAEDFSDQFKDNGIVMICGECEKEQKIDQKAIASAGWKLSHGTCVRHGALQMMRRAGIPDDTIRNYLHRDRTGQGGTRDLKEPKNEPLLKWLRNPPQNEEKHQDVNPTV